MGPQDTVTWSLGSTHSGPKHKQQDIEMAASPDVSTQEKPVVVEGSPDNSTQEMEMEMDNDSKFCRVPVNEEG